MLSGGNKSFEIVFAIYFRILRGGLISIFAKEIEYYSLLFSKKDIKKSAKSLGNPPSVS
jgi:hypothetical protein